MYASEIKVGMKVRPVIKTIEGPLSNSKQWSEAQAMGQKFLWVIKVSEANGKKPTYILNMAKDAKVGDRFNSIDLRTMDWKGWGSRLPSAKHETMEDIRARAKKGDKKPVKQVVKKAPTAKKQTVKKVAVAIQPPLPL